MKLTRKSILAALEEHKPAIQACVARRIGLFGSAAREEATDNSDLDFVVDFDRKSFDGYMDLKFLLEDLFGRRADLVLVDAIKPRLRNAILSEAVYVA